MKKILSVLLAVALLGFAVGCSGDSSPSDTPAAEAPAETADAAQEDGDDAAQDAPAGDTASGVDMDNLRETVGNNPLKDEYYFVFVPKLVHPFYEPIKVGFEAAIAEYAEQGITITWDWDAPAAADAILQTEKIEQAVVKSPDVIGIAVQEPAVIDAVVGDVESAGVPVVLFADDTASGTGSAFVGVKSFIGSGEYMGEELAKAIDYQGEVALLLGTLTAQSHTERIEGIKNVLAGYPDITIVAEQASDDDLEKAVQETEKLLNAYPNLAAIASGDGSGAAGAARAIVDSGKMGEVLVFGFDDIDENIAGIREGSIVSTYAQDGFATGYYTLKAMVEVADHDYAEKLSIESPQRLLSIDTVDEYGY